MKRTISIFLDLVLIFAAFTSLISAYLTVADHFRLVRVVSDSMAPKFHKGDFLLVKAIPANSLKVGEIAVLPSLDEPGVYYTHRIINKQFKAGKLLLNTKGDANPLADDWTFSITSKDVPIYIWQLPTSRIPFLPSNSWLTTAVYGSTLLLIASYFIPVRSRKILRPELEATNAIAES